VNATISDEGRLAVADRMTSSELAARYGEMMTPAEVAARFGVSVDRVRMWAVAGKLDGAVVMTPGGHRRYRREAIDALVNGSKP
jgi:excisionase family DNA binding protein